MQASVARKPSMVAMFGRIMPAPLLMPVTVTVAPLICSCRLKALGTVSVVMMPSAARAQWPPWASASAAGRPATMRSTGSGSMITPVENGSTWPASMPSWPASASQVARARARPSAPVPALALPVLMTMARIAWPPSKCSRQTCTGAAQKRFCVNTPATVVPSSSRNTVRSLRLALRTPASATPMRTPATGRRSAACGAERFTGMEHSWVKQGDEKQTRAAARVVQGRSIRQVCRGTACIFYHCRRGRGRCDRRARRAWPGPARPWRSGHRPRFPPRRSRWARSRSRC